MEPFVSIQFELNGRSRLNLQEHDGPNGNEKIGSGWRGARASSEGARGSRERARASTKGAKGSTEGAYS